MISPAAVYRVPAEIRSGFTRSLPMVARLNGVLEAR